MSKFLYSLLFLSLLASYFSSSYFRNLSAGGRQTFELEVTVDIKNNTGRELRSLDVSYLLPLGGETVQKEVNASIGNDSTVLARFTPVNVYSGEEVELKDRVLLRTNSSLEAEVPIPKNDFGVGMSFKSISDGAGIRDYNKTLRLLSEEYQYVRLVSGVLLLPRVVQTPKCWIQYKSSETADWISFSPGNTRVIPFKVMLPLDGVSDEICREEIVQVWGVNVTSIAFTINPVTQ
ncbi:hypothetical protein LZP73_19120 [Shewanella sp. AS16]|uniref:hypothetical protein n=1 Tax=Shewanella sp. AS16 TaxID=2907625 RepID=UPI001F292C3E|nr:hypothetical protein [Shewanella sp. AS16]MCE9688283.1 hypothetical protein [Shewanella sp. AS16]